MTRKLFFCGVTLVVFIFSIAGATAGPVPSLTTAPTGFTCSVGTDSVVCSWDQLEGANKYSVDVVANYTLNDGVTTASADFDFGTEMLEITIPLDAFPPDINGDTLPDNLTGLVLRVKGLNPPGKKDYNQNTPFSSSIVCNGGGCAPLM